MCKVGLLAIAAVLSIQAASAREIRHPAIPESFQGTWASDPDACKAGDKSKVVLSATSYTGPAGSCIIDYVMEVPGPVYSARMRCSENGLQTQANTIANLIIRPGTGGQILVGPTFENLVVHQRCAPNAPAAK